MQQGSDGLSRGCCSGVSPAAECVPHPCLVPGIGGSCADSCVIYFLLAQIKTCCVLRSRSPLAHAVVFCFLFPPVVEVNGISCQGSALIVVLQSPLRAASPRYLGSLAKEAYGFLCPEFMRQCWSSRGERCVQCLVLVGLCSQMECHPQLVRQALGFLANEIWVDYAMCLMKG